MTEANVSRVSVSQVCQNFVKRASCFASPLSGPVEQVAKDATSSCGNTHEVNYSVHEDSCMPETTQALKCSKGVPYYILSNRLLPSKHALCDLPLLLVVPSKGTEPHTGMFPASIKVPNTSFGCNSFLIPSYVGKVSHNSPLSASSFSVKSSESHTRTVVTKFSSNGLNTIHSIQEINTIQQTQESGFISANRGCPQMSACQSSTHSHSTYSGFGQTTVQGDDLVGNQASLPNESLAASLHMQYASQRATDSTPTCDVITETKLSSTTGCIFSIPEGKGDDKSTSTKTRKPKDSSKKIRKPKDESAQKKFACSHPSCFSKFTTKAHLQRHSTRHTKGKSFQCEICLKFFSRNDNMRSHKTKKHGLQIINSDLSKDSTTEGTKAIPQHDSA